MGMRTCKFCGCKTNIRLRFCCARGNKEDREKNRDKSKLPKL